MRLLWVLVFVILGFLFQCGKSDDSSKDDSAKDGDPPPAILKLSTPDITFNDVDGSMGDTYTISVSRPPSAEKTIEVTLTSTNPLLEVSPTVVTFTPVNYASPQTITVKRANDANDVITAEITGTINHVITTGTAEFAEFAMMKRAVNVTVRPTNVKLSTPDITFNDVDGAVGATYTILVSRSPSEGKTVEVKLTSTNVLLAVSPEMVTFTPANYASPQTITVKRANDANDIITTEITGEINHVITMGTSHDAEFTEFAMMNDTVNVTVTPYTPDADGDGLIEIWAAAMLDNMRYDPAGTSYKTSAMSPGNSSGCPAGGCNGYELMANIDLLPLLDANGNGEIDTTTKTIANVMHTVIDVGSDKDTSWVPVGGDFKPFTGTFEGNGRTIANLWVHISSSSGNGYAGLFGATNGTVAIRNVGVVSGGVSSSSFGSSPGGLVGRSLSSSSLTITNSYFSGEGGVSSSSSSFASHSGGLVGRSSSFSLTIRNSYFSGEGGVSSSSPASSASHSGGLVGRSSSSLTITNSYFSGEGGVSSAVASFAASHSGGLVGLSDVTLTITNSYFSGGGGVSSSADSSIFSNSGGLVGFSSSSLTITNSYWNTDAPQSTDGGVTLRNVGNKRTRGNSMSEPMGAVRLTLAQLKATSGTFPDLGDAWDLGTTTQLPAVKQCILDATMTGCASPAMYGALLGGQR